MGRRNGAGPVRDRRSGAGLILRLGVCTGCAVLMAFSEGTAAPRRASPSVRRARGEAYSGVGTVGGGVGALPASVAIGGAERRVPSSYLGLSFEYPDLLRYARAGVAVDRAIRLIGAADSSRMILRVGGESADRAWWDWSREPPAPRGVFAFGRPWLTALAGMLARDRLSAVLDLNLAVHSPALAASFASAARSILGRELVGVEIGNEPDHYGRQPWLARQLVGAGERGVSAHWTHAYTPLHYQHDYRVYAEALRAAVGGMPIGAPELASPAVRWLAPLVGLGRLRPDFVSVHRYASSSCWPKASPRYPSIGLLLSESVSAGLAASLRHVIAFARAHGIPLRVTELGTISCGGNLGIANAFATALWAPDILFELLQGGVSAVNWHQRANAVNAPFALTAAGIAPRPALYGLAVFAQVTGGPHAVLDRCIVDDPGLHLKAWAVRHRHTLAVLLINKGRRAAAVALRAGRVRSATLERLTAPSASATGGVRYAGRWIGADGQWHGRLRIARLAVRDGIARVLVPGTSAAVITLS